MLVTRTDFEDVSDVSGYMSSGQTCRVRPQQDEAERMRQLSLNE